MIDHEHPDEFTNQDFKAISTLNVSLLLSARAWLRGAGLKTVRKYLRTIPKDLDIWRVEPEKYAGLLGRKSKAWKLWEILADLQRKGRARRAGVGVTAGKALHGKRSRLIPVYDREGIGRIPGVTQRNIREVMWCALRDTDIRERLEQLRAEVPEAPSCHSFGSSISSSGWRSDRSLARSSTTPTSVIRHCGLPGSRQRASPEPPAPFASHPG